MPAFLNRGICCTIVLLLIAVSPLSANQQYTEAHVLVDSSLSTLQQFNADPNMQVVRDLSKRARGIIIIPQMLRGGLIVGGTGGSGIMFARDMKTGHWKGPAFYTLGSLTFGIQLGAEASQIIMFVMTEKGLNSMLSSSFKLGADVTIAAGPVGGGAKAATVDIVSYARSKGAFGGFTIDGGVMSTKDGWNNSYYDSLTNPQEILITGSVVNNHADNLRNLITEIGTPTTKKVKY